MQVKSWYLKKSKKFLPNCQLVNLKNKFCFLCTRTHQKIQKTILDNCWIHSPLPFNQWVMSRDPKNFEITSFYLLSIPFPSHIRNETIKWILRYADNANKRFCKNIKSWIFFVNNKKIFLFLIKSTVKKR